MKKSLKLPKFWWLAIFIIIFSIQSNLANSHSGRTNSEGCHNQTSNGTYHCHKPKSQKQNKSNNKVNVKVQMLITNAYFAGQKRSQSFALISNKSSNLPLSAHI